MFPAQWSGAESALELLDEVVRGAESGAGGNFVDVEVAFSQEPFRFGEAVREDDLSERLPKAGGARLVEARTRFVEGVGDLLCTKRPVQCNGAKKMVWVGVV